MDAKENDSNTYNMPRVEVDTAAATIATSSSNGEYGGGEAMEESIVAADLMALSLPTPTVDPAYYSAGRSPPSASVASGVPAWAANGAADEPLTSSLQLQFVYGARTGDCRAGVRLTASGELAFHSASLVVLYDPHRHAQRFLRGHDGEVRCLALHPTGRVLASGQAAGGRAEICTWVLDATEPTLILSGAHPAGVAALAFSAGPSGDRLASLGCDAEHTVAVWDWQRGVRLLAHATGAAPMLGLAWAPHEPSLATVGVGCARLVRTH